jgi:hypothetical protein
MNLSSRQFVPIDTIERVQEAMSHGQGLHHQGMTSVGRDHLETITRRLSDHEPALMHPAEMLGQSTAPARP